MIKKFITLSLLLFISFLSFSNNKTIKIGFIQDGNSEKLQLLKKLITKETKELTKSEFNVEFSDKFDIQCNWDYNCIKDNLNKYIKNKNIDLVIANGIVSSELASKLENYPIPIIATNIFDVNFQQVPLKGNTSGIKNLTYIDIRKNFKKDLQTLYSLYPYKNLTILYPNYYNLNKSKSEKFVKNLLKDKNIKINFLTISKNLTNWENNLMEFTDAVYITSLDNLTYSQIENLLNQLNKMKIPTFAASGYKYVEKGALAGFGNKDLENVIARQTALNIQRILTGEKAKDIPLYVNRVEKLYINMKTSRKIDVYPTYKMLTDSVLLKNKEQLNGEIWDLSKTINEALKVNLSLIAKQKELESGKQDVKSAKGYLLPTLQTSITGAKIDKDRTSSVLNIPEKSITGNLKLTQLLYSEDALANYSIKKYIQKSKTYDFDSLKLNIELDAGLAYLTILQTEINEKIQRDNLELSRSNLELAKIRVDSGYSGPSEVYRWESEIAFRKNALIEAGALKAAAIVQMNRILNRDLENQFQVSKIGIKDPCLIINDPLIKPYLNDPWHFRILRDYVVENAISNSPEIKKLDQLIKAQLRELKASKRNMYMPTIAFQAEYSDMFKKSGAGSESLQLPPEFSSILPPIDDKSWSLGLNLSFDLYSGGKNSARNKKAKKELERLTTLRKNAVNQLSANVISALHKAGASYTSIELTEESAKAARKNLELVIDAYSRGVVSITQLIEAQNASMVSEQLKANAVYQFIKDYLTVDRLTGKLMTFANEKEREKWLLNLREFCKKYKNK